MKMTSSQDTLLGKFRTAGLWLALGLACEPCSLAAAASAKPNVLFIITDQQFAKVMSCRRGKQYINTPAMDSLAARGMLFTCAYSSNPLCMPWRIMKRKLLTSTAIVS